MIACGSQQESSEERNFHWVRFELLILKGNVQYINLVFHTLYLHLLYCIERAMMNPY